jgi:hypothetical protein
MAYVHVGAAASFIAPRCNNRGGKAADPYKHSKGHSKHKFTHHPNSSHDAPSTSRDMATVSKTGPMITVGPQQLKVLRQIPPVRSEPPRANKAKDEVTQRVTSSWCIRGPMDGTRHL